MSGSSVPRSVVLISLGWVALSGGARAQKLETRFEWQKRVACFTYGVPRVGKHTLDDLKVGTSWRMGANDITTLAVDAPLLVGDGFVPPGVYRVNVGRPASDSFNLAIEGAATRTAGGTENVVVPATLANAPKANDKLEITFTPAKEQNDAELRLLTLSVQFGIPRLTVPMTIVGTQSFKTKNFTVDAFKLPEKWVLAQLRLKNPAPVALLVRVDKPGAGIPERLNLLLSENEATLVPTMRAPTESYGFGAIPKLDPDWILKGSVTWSDAAKEADHFRVDSVSIDARHVLHVTAVCGARQAAIAVPTLPVKR
jgi:hypothetical protein